jgi:hypothetical protein
MLPSRNERIKDNLSSAQWVEILDQFIYSGIDIIIAKSPMFFLQWTCDMLCDINVSPHKRLFSVNLPLNELHTTLMRIITGDPAERNRLLRYAALDRVYLFTLLGRYLDVLAKAQSDRDANASLESKYLATHTLELPSWRIEPVYNQVRMYDRLARDFVGIIAEKYYRLAYTRTQAMVKGVGLMISQEDLYANNVMTIVRSIYKYSATKGTLTNFILQWMQANNSPRFGHEYGQAYSLPQSKRNELSKQNWETGAGAVVNLASDLDDALDVSADLYGHSTEQTESMLEVVYKAASYLRDDHDVVFYMQASSYPYLGGRLTRPDAGFLSSVAASVKTLCAGQRPNTDQLNVW